MARRRFLILYLIGLAICGLVVGISYAVITAFDLPKDLAVVLVYRWAGANTRNSCGA